MSVSDGVGGGAARNDGSDRAGEMKRQAAASARAANDAATRLVRMNMGGLRDEWARMGTLAPGALHENRALRLRDFDFPGRELRARRREERVAQGDERCGAHGHGE